MNEKINNAKSKTEEAKLLGIKVPEDDYWGDYSSKACGTIGGAIGGNFTKGDVSNFDQKLEAKTKENKKTK